MPIYNFILFAGFYLCIALSHVSAQPVKFDPAPEPPSQTIFLELGGSFIFLGGINYERIVLRKSRLFVSLRSGFGLDLWHFSGPSFAIPVGATVNLGREHYLELGATATFSIWPEKISPEQGEPEQYFWHYTHEIQPLIGYRFQPERPGFIFRATLTPIFLPLCSSLIPKADCNRRTLAPWVGISGGVAF